MTEREDLKALQAENVRLVALLESHGIAWHAPPAAAAPAAPIASVPAPAPASPGPSVSTAEKVGLDENDGQAPMEDVEVPCLVPLEQRFAGQEAPAGVANGLGP